jgi:hypothetical protein
VFDQGLAIQHRSSLHGKRFVFEGFGVSPDFVNGPEWRIVAQLFLNRDELVITLGHLKKKDVQISGRRKTLGTLIDGETIAPLAVRNARGTPESVRLAFVQAKAWLMDTHPGSKWYWRAG